MRWSGRERGWWIASLALILLIYSTLYLVRAPVEFLRERNLLRLSVLAAFGAAAVPVAWLVWRRRPGLREGLALAAGGALFVALIGIAERPEEKLHFLEYGLLGAMLHTACSLRAVRLARTGRMAAVVTVLEAAVLGAMAGAGDEGIQALLPNRVFDLRDIVFNLTASSVAVAVLALAAQGRRADCDL